MAADCLPADPTMPSLAQLWSAPLPNALLDWGAQPGLGALRIERIRYRQGQRAVITYAAHEGTDAPTWLTAFVHAGKSARRRFRRLNETSGHVRYLDEFDALVQRFPLDQHLPQLQSMVKTLPDSLLESLDPRHAGGYALQPARYRPGFGATLRVIADGREDAFVKLYRPGTVSPYAAYQRRLADALRQLCNIDAPTPRRVDTGSDALLLDRVRGMALDELLATRQLTTREIGAVVAGLQRIHRTVTLPVTTTRYGDTLLSRVHRTATLLAWALPEMRAVLDRVTRDIAARQTTIAVPSHCDLKADHVFLDADGSLGLVDLDSFALADPLYDPATLVVRLVAMPWRTAEGLRNARDAAGRLLAMWQSTASGDLPRWGGNLAAAALKVAQYHVQHQTPDWRAAASQLIANAAHCLAAPDAPIPGINLTTREELP